MTTYALMRDGSLNVSASFRTKAAALKAINRALEVGETAIVNETSLFQSGPGEWVFIAKGADLAQLATGRRTRTAA